PACPRAIDDPSLAPRASYPVAGNEKSPPGFLPRRALCPIPVDDESTTVRRSHDAAVMATGAAFPSPTPVLRGILLQLRQVGVELLLLIGGEDGAHRRESTLALLLHLRTQRLHLRTRRRRCAALPG